MEKVNCEEVLCRMASIGLVEFHPDEYGLNRITITNKGYAALFFLEELKR